MINDFAPSQLGINHYKYVDDLTLCQTFSDLNECSNLQGELNRLQQWSDSNKMKLNPAKCQYMNICLQRNPAHIPPFVISDFQIQQTECMKLLGVYIQSDLKWDSQINNMCRNFNRRLYFLRQLKRSKVSVKNLLTVYVMYVRPTIEYACPVWYSGLSKAQFVTLERLQKKAFRIILAGSVKPYKDICQEYGLPTITDRLEQLFLNFGKTLLDSKTYRHWLPQNRNNNLRNSNKMCTLRCRTSRYKNSCIPSLVDVLNKWN